MRLRLGLLFTAAATLMLELLLTRVFDVILTPNLAYMVIACALFAFGLAGVTLSLWKRAPVHLPGLALLFAAAMVLLLPILNWLPFDYEAISEQPLTQVVSFTLMYLALVAPFFLAGLIFTLVFSQHAASIQALYFWDLLGAAAGCLLVVPLVAPIGPGGMLFVAGALAAAASAMFASSRRWIAAAAAAAVLLAATPFLRAPAYFEFTEHLDKRGVREARRAGQIEISRWDPISKIDVIDQTGRDLRGHENASFRRKHIAYDGGTQSSHIYPFDGDFGRLRTEIESGREPLVKHFWHRGVLASHYAKRDSAARVLVIGSAGGQETKAALMYGAASVDAVELVGAVVELMTGRYAAYSGGLFLDPRVHVRTGEGRSVLRRAAGRYDIIQIHSNQTSSSIAAGTGAMAPHYLQTADAYRDYFTHLAPDGVLQINHVGFARMISTAALAWRQMGHTDFQRHVLVFGMASVADTLPTLLIRMQPWTPAQIAELSSFFSRTGADEIPFEILQHPLDAQASFLPPEFFSGEQSPALLAQAGLQIRAATDDRPFFNFMRKGVGPVQPSQAAFVDPATALVLNSQLRRNIIPMDLIHLIVTGVVSLVCAALFIVIPLVKSDIRHATSGVKYASMFYFSSLGAGFILFELVFVQIFMKLIGYPVHTYALVIFTLLLGAGVGSMASRPLGISPRARWSWPFIGILGYGAAFAWIYPAVFDRFLSAPDATRMIVAAALIFPLGFCLGMPFPLGILLAERQPRGAVAWAWGLNGLFTVIGSLASVLLGLAIGFRATILVAVAIYAGALFAFAILRVAAEAVAHETAGGVALTCIQEPT